jgi:hypothetical protein
MIATKEKDDEYLWNCDGSCGPSCVILTELGFPVAGTKAYGTSKCVLCHRYNGNVPYFVVPDGYPSGFGWKSSDYRWESPNHVIQFEGMEGIVTWLSLFTIGGDPPRQVLYSCTTCGTTKNSMEILGATEVLYDVENGRSICCTCKNVLEKRTVEHCCIICTVMVEPGHYICKSCEKHYSTLYRQTNMRCHVCNIPVPVHKSYTKKVESEDGKILYCCKNHKN